ncbi:MAG: response regulator [Lacipirellulaceae bacterium]
MPSSQRVLIVDPNSETRGVLRTLVERLGAEGREAATPSAGERVAAGETPDLIVIDIDGERLSTAAAADSLRDWAARNGVPVVLLGARRPLVAGVGGDEFLRKPYHFGALAHRIRGTLASRRAA